jgi:hypothetical protein
MPVREQIRRSEEAVARRTFGGGREREMKEREEGEEVRGHKTMRNDAHIHAHKTKKHTHTTAFMHTHTHPHTQRQR